MFSILSYISSSFVLIPLVFGLFKKKSLSPILFPILYLIILSGFTEGINIILSTRSINSMFLINSFTILEFSLLSIFYLRFFKGYYPPKLFYVLIVLFTCLVIFSSFFINEITVIDGLSYSVESLIFMAYSLFAFYLILKKLLFQHLLESPFFWINTAILIYFSGNLFFFLFSTYLQKFNIKDFGTFYALHSVLNITYYILISIGFWKVNRE